MTEKNRKAKSSGPRTEVFAMRLDPKLKYLAEIAARKQRRSLANFIEWSLEQSLKSVSLSEDSQGQWSVNVLDEASKLWDLEASDRFLKLVENYPDLLTYEEQLIWKAIQEVTAGEYITDKEGKKSYHSINFIENSGGKKKIDKYLVKDCWLTLVGYSDGSKSLIDLKKEMNLHIIPF